MPPRSQRTYLRDLPPGKRAGTSPRCRSFPPLPSGGWRATGQPRYLTELIGNVLLSLRTGPLTGRFSDSVLRAALLSDRDNTELRGRWRGLYKVQLIAAQQSACQYAFFFIPTACARRPKAVVPRLVPPERIVCSVFNAPQYTRSTHPQDADEFKNIAPRLVRHQSR